MKTNKLIDVLKDIGLSENESEVYFSTLSLGPTTILKIAKSSGLKRTTVYSVIESLKQKGLMNIQVDGFKKKFTAEDPQKLESILSLRKKKLDAILPEFAAMYNLQGGESIIKYYEGLEAVKGVYESLIRDIRPGQDYLVFANNDKWLSLDKDFFSDFLQRRAKLPIKIRMLIQDTPSAREMKKFERNYNGLVKLLPSDTQIKTNLIITPQRMMMHQLVPPVTGIVIENKSAIEMHKEMYEIIWKSIKD